MKTTLNKWFNMTIEGHETPIYTHDTWEIPESGTEIWCTLWAHGQRIKPYGDGYHVVVGAAVYHCDELMDILTQNEKEGYQWGIEGVTHTREQFINARWQPAGNLWVCRMRNEMTNDVVLWMKKAEVEKLIARMLPAVEVSK